jgi:hypothetical protein
MKITGAGLLGHVISNHRAWWTRATRWRWILPRRRQQDLRCVNIPQFAVGCVFVFPPTYTLSNTKQCLHEAHVINDKLHALSPAQTKTQLVQWLATSWTADFGFPAGAQSPAFASPSRPGLGSVLPPFTMDTGKSFPGGTEHDAWSWQCATIQYPCLKSNTPARCDTDVSTATSPSPVTGGTLRRSDGGITKVRH